METRRDTIAQLAVSDLRQGLVTAEGGRLSFVPCGSSDTLDLTAADPLASIVREVGPDSGQAVFVIARMPSGTLADTVFYASRDRFECHSDWTSFAYRATGNDPGWVAEVKGGMMQLRRQGAADTVVPITRTTGPGIRFAAAGNGVELDLEWRRCSQGNGSYHAWSATLRIGGRAWLGCAVPGARGAN